MAAYLNASQVLVNCDPVERAGGCTAPARFSNGLAAVRLSNFL